MLTVIEGIIIAVLIYRLMKQKEEQQIMERFMSMLWELDMTSMRSTTEIIHAMGLDHRADTEDEQ